jgi:asparagine synthase (glutamine-hydrolysing)
VIGALEGEEANEILESCGDKLIRDYWGGYVAAISTAGTTRLLRDPSGALPCYLTRTADYVLAGSHVDLLLATDLVETSIDWSALAHHLYSAGLPRHETVLTGIHELLAGFSVDIPGHMGGQRPFWSPWDHVRTWVGEDPAQSAERLKRTIVRSVRGWTSSSKRVLLSVSGGLDSSIVAACLATCGGPEVHCLTMFGDDAGGDERDYARAVCERLGLPLIEHRYRVEDVDIEAPLAAHLPRPFGRTQAHAYEQAHLDVARKLGIDAFVTGNGGDNVFAYSQSASAIADRYLGEGIGIGLLHTIRDTCLQTGCGAATATRSAVRILRAPRSYRWQSSPSLLHPGLLVELAASRLDHPWLEAPPGAPPGKAGHIAALLRVQLNLEPGRARYAPVLNPLLSQPVVEACLGIPSWQWRAHGFDRAVARDAFREDLPELIVRRRSKGGPDGFTAQLIVRYRHRIRERLLDGHLAANRLVDTAALDRLLADERPTLGQERARVLALLATEAWLDFWIGRLRAANRRSR